MTTAQATKRVTIALIGLGSGSRQALPPENWQYLTRATRRFVTTAQHPLCQALQTEGFDVEDVSSLLASAPSEQAAVRALAEHLSAAVRAELTRPSPPPLHPSAPQSNPQGNPPPASALIALGIPGHPLADHLPAAELIQQLERNGYSVTVLSAPGHLDALYGQLDNGLRGGLRLHRPSQLEPDDLDLHATHVVRPTVCGQDAQRLSDSLAARYPATHRLTLWTLPGSPTAEVRPVTIKTLAEQPGQFLSPLTWLTIPPAPPAVLRSSTLTPASALASAATSASPASAATPGKRQTRSAHQAAESAHRPAVQPSPHPLDPLVDVMARLRAPEGCPWDREQDHLSLRPYMIEEAYEAVDAIESGDPNKLMEELGDVLLQVVFHSQLAAEEQRFTIDDVVRTVTEKMIRRHPHVFGDVEAKDSDAVLRNWEAIKQQEPGKERDGEPPSVLQGIPRHLPALVEADKVQSRAARVGFEWSTVEGALAKVQEEWRELQQAQHEHSPTRVQQEWGDLLFALVNVSRYWGIDSELALRQTTQKFRARFQHIEQTALAQGRDLRDMTLEEMDALWEAAKALE